MKQLLFQGINGKVRFNDGINLTVRKGLKWAKLRHGDSVEIWDVDSQGEPLTHLYYAIISKVECYTLKSIIPSMLKLEHEPECRTVTGLQRELIKIYKGIGDNDPLTLIWFVITD